MISSLQGYILTVTLILSLVITIPSPVMAEEPHKQLSAGSASLRSALYALVVRLPSIFAMKVSGKKAASMLPDYEGSVTVPDSELIYSWIAELCQTPHRRPGTPEGHRAEQWINGKFKEIGLENVTMDPIDMTVWTAEKWSLEAGGEHVPSFFVVNSGFTGPEGVTAPMVYVGKGSAKQFNGLDVSGKIVVADVTFPWLPTGLLFKILGGAYTVSDPDGQLTVSSSQCMNFVRTNFLGHVTEADAPDTDVYWNAHKRGAAAVCLILRNQPSNSNTHYGPYDGIMKPMPGLWIGKYDGERLREMAMAGEEATLVLTGTKEPGVMHNVWGVLPGLSDEVILVTSHHDSPFEGAVEDGSGTANVIAQAWAWSRVPKQDRPCTMVFVVDAGHFYGSLGGHTFARTHKDIMDRTKILVTLEHLAAKEVEEVDRKYAETGNLALTVMFTTHDAKVVGAVMKALDKTPPKLTASIPSDLFAEAPTSDASGYVLEAGVPVVSWIGCPYYLLDAHDTLDKIEVSELKPTAETAAALIGIFHAMD